MTEDLSSQVKFTWRYLVDPISEACPAGVLSMEPTTGETLDEWWNRQIKVGRGLEAQQLLEKEFIRLYEMGMWTRLIVFIPIRSDVPPSSDLYRSWYGQHFAYLVDHQSQLSDPVQEALEFEMDALVAERLALAPDGFVDEYPSRRAFWWVVPINLIRAALADHTKEWFLYDLRGEAAKEHINLICVDELNKEEYALAVRYGIYLLGGIQEPVEDILKDYNDSPFGLEPGETPFGLMPRDAADVDMSDFEAESND